MNYINRGKQDILIFPKFNNISKIQNIRKKYDELAEILPPHITIVFPSKFEFNKQELKKKISNILKKYNSFKIKCKGISFVKDEKVNKYYIFLNIVEGNDIIKNISIDLYNNLLNKELPKKYVPHITLGAVEKIVDIQINDTFETEINEIAVESIGENEESLIEFYIKLEE